MPATDAERAKRIRETAREIGTDNNPEALERAFKKVVHSKKGEWPVLDEPVKFMFKMAPTGRRSYRSLNYGVHDLRCMAQSRCHCEKLCNR